MLTFDLFTLTMPDRRFHVTVDPARVSAVEERDEASAGQVYPVAVLHLDGGGRLVVHDSGRTVAELVKGGRAPVRRGVEYLGG